jgi:hypothetical protein
VSDPLWFVLSTVTRVTPSSLSAQSRPVRLVRRYTNPHTDMVFPLSRLSTNQAQECRKAFTFTLVHLECYLCVINDVIGRDQREKEGRRIQPKGL